MVTVKQKVAFDIGTSQSGPRVKTITSGVRWIYIGPLVYSITNFFEYWLIHKITAAMQHHLYNCCNEDNSNTTNKYVQEIIVELRSRRIPYQGLFSQKAIPAHTFHAENQDTKVFE